MIDAEHDNINIFIWLPSGSHFYIQAEISL